MTSACFASNVFEDSQAEKCISNLLAAQFKRFIIDLYWDSSLRQFMFCPVSIQSRPQNLSSNSIILTNSVQTSQSIFEVPVGETNTQTTSVLETPSEGPSTESSTGVRGNIRRAASSTPENVSNATSRTSESSTPLATQVSTSNAPSGITLYEIGSYQCSSSLNLPFLASLVRDYIGNTSNNLSANLLFLQFNLHAAASENAPTDAAPSLSGPDLPSQTELLGNVFNAVTSPLPYQPSELLTQRANLNSSWYTLVASEQPSSDYFLTEDLPGGEKSTPDGWPSEYFAELRRNNRVILSWGSIDPQMEDYAFFGDSDVVFAQNYISSSTEVHANAAGQIQSGCFYNSEQPTVAQSNSSWAVSILNGTDSNLGSSGRLWSMAANLASCGITPILNGTLGNHTVDQTVSPYVQFVQSTVWNWAPEEPRNASVPDTSSRRDESTQGEFRCAMMESSATSTASRWRVEYCNIRHRVACRVAHQPYLWRLSEDSVPFSAAEMACQPNSSFSVPRTGLENTYLYQHILSLPEASRSGLAGDGSGVWLNFNSLDIEACWVTTGPNGSCRYFFDEEALRQRTVLVPVIAALVVLLLTALTLFVKCNKNRRNSRKRIRGEGGWDYEGVPS
jgi:hypothetical protein